MSVVVAQPMQAQANLPLNPKLIYTPPDRVNMRIESETIDPIVNRNKQYVRFQLPTKGILDNTSLIVFEVSGQGTSMPAKITFPFLSGAYSLLDRVVLTAPNGVVIDEIDACGQYKTFQKLFRPNENAILKEQYTKMSSPELKFIDYNPLECDYMDGAGMEDFQAYPNRVGAAGDGSDEDFNYSSHHNLSRVSDDFHGYGNHGLRQGVKMEVSFKLSELFPFFKNNQFNLFMYDKPLTIELFLNQTGSAIVGTEHNDANVVVGDYQINNVELQADLLYFNNQIMQQLSTTKDAGLYQGIAYHSVAIPVGITNQISRQRIEIPASGLLVQAIYIQNNPYAVAGGRAGNVAGVYNSPSTFDESYNIRINDETIFDQDVDNSALLYSLTSQAGGNNLQMLQGMYSGKLANGAVNDGHSRGKGHFVAFDLGAGGRKVGLNPIEIFYNRNINSSASVCPASTLNVFIVYAKTYVRSANAFSVGDV